VSLVGLRLLVGDPPVVLDCMRATIFGRLLYVYAVGIGDGVDGERQRERQCLWVDGRLTMSSGSSGHRVAAPEPFGSMVLFIKRIFPELYGFLN
jgi:hypothetical protein